MIVPLAAAALAALAPLHPGLWSSVRVSPGSGDYDGLELRIPAAAARMVTVSVCEGGCSLAIQAPIVRDANGFDFDVVEATANDQGRADTLPARHCHAHFDGDVLVVQWLGEDRVDILRRRARPLALPRATRVLVKRAGRS